MLDVSAGRGGRRSGQDACPSEVRRKDALSLAIRRGCDSREFDSVTHEIGDWLHEEMVATYGAARIEQLLQRRLENELPW